MAVLIAPIAKATLTGIVGPSRWGSFSPLLGSTREQKIDDVLGESAGREDHRPRRNAGCILVI